MPLPPTGNAMPQVSVTINGRQFRMACEDGEEEHLQKLAADLDDPALAARKAQQ